MKKALSLLIAAVLLLLPSCDKTDEEQNSNESLITNLYNGDGRTLPEGYELCMNVTPYYDSTTGSITCAAVINSLRYDDEGNMLDGLQQEKYLITLAGDGSSEITLLELEGEEMSYINYGVITEDCFIYLANTNNYETGDTTYSIIRCSRSDGSFEKSDGIEALFDSGYSLRDLTVDKDGFIYVSAGEEIVVLDENFIRQFSLYEVDTYGRFAVSPDGTVYNILRSSQNLRIAPIDTRTKSYGKAIECGEAESVRSVFFTSEDDGYDMYCAEADGLYGIKLSDKSRELIMDFSGAALSDRFAVRKMIDRDTVIAYDLDPEAYQFSVSLYTKAEDLDLSEIKVIEIAAASDTTSELAALITSFNRNNPDLRVIVTDYSQYNSPEDPYGGMTKLTTDILNGLYKPDIVCGSPSDEVIQQIIANGLYTDLYPFIDRDESIDRDDLFGAFTRTYSTDGKLWGICCSFDVMTLISPTSIAGERESWTFTDAIELASSLPDGVDLAEGITQSVAPYAIFGMSGYSAFIDEENNTADFASEKFIDYLEYVASLPTEIDYASLTDDSYIRRHNGEIALESAELQDPVDWLGLEAIFNTKDYTLIGYPTARENEYGSYISSDSSYLMTSFTEYPEEVWSFLREIVCSEMKTDLYNMTFRGDGFPILKSAYDEAIVQFTAFEYIFGLDGSIEGSNRYDPEAPTTPDDLAEPGIITRLTEEESAALKDFLDNKAGAPWTETADAEVTAIVNEEISAFTSGMHTAEETADIIQSRVNIWLAEHE